MALNEQRRRQLDEIVLKMAAQNAPKEDVDLIVNDFIRKYHDEQPVVKQENKSIARKVGDFFTSNTQKFGNTLGDAMAVQSRDVKQAVSSQASLDETNDKLAKQIIKLKKEGKDTSILEKTYQNNTGNRLDLSKIVPSINKTNKQIFGEALGTATEALSGGMMTKAAGSIGAKTTGQALVRGALNQIPEAAVAGAATSVSGAMQSNKSAKDIAVEGLKGAGIASIIGGVVGGLSARSKFLQPEKADQMRESAVAQYKKGLQATKEKYKEKSDKIIPELLDKGWWGTRKNLLKKAEEGINLSEKEYEQLGELAGVTNINGIIDNIDKEIGKYTLASGRVSSVNAQRVNALKELKADILSVDSMDNIADGVAGQQKMRELAQQYGKEVYETRRAQKTISDNKTLSQVKKVDGMIRELLNKDPRNIKYAEINKTFHLNSELAEILEETAFRKEGHKVVNIIRALSGTGGATAGAMTGGLPGMLIGSIGLSAFTEVMNSTWWNTLRAVQKNKIADKLLLQSKQEMANSLKFLAKNGMIAANKYLND